MHKLSLVKRLVENISETLDDGFVGKVSLWLDTFDVIVTDWE